MFPALGGIIELLLELNTGVLDAVHGKVLQAVSGSMVRALHVKWVKVQKRAY
jgi:hypothetical protein